MANTMEKLHSVNSFIRTMLALVVVGGAGTAGWYGYSNYTAADREAKANEEQLVETRQALVSATERLQATQATVDQQAGKLKQQAETIAEQGHAIVALSEELKLKEEEIQRLDTALRLHKLERRLARITVLDVREDADSGTKHSRIEFQEMSDAGEPIGKAREFEIEGDMIYVDYLVVKFDDQYVEQADLQRGMSICLFNRIFGEFQKPKDGFYLDEPGSQPDAYTRGNLVSDFEKKIWNDFWEIANNPSRAAELGIRALHGDAVSIRVTPGKTYRITVRSSGGPEIEVAEDRVRVNQNRAGA